MAVIDISNQLMAKIEKEAENRQLSLEDYLTQVVSSSKTEQPNLSSPPYPHVRIDSIASLQTLLEIIATPVIITDEHGNICHFNEKVFDFFGYEHDELMDQSIQMLFPDLLETHQLNPNGNLSGNGKNYSTGVYHHIVGLSRYDKNLSLEVGISPLLIDNNAYFVIFACDSDEQKHHNQEILATEKVRKNILKLFINKITDHFKDPLTIIQTNLFLATQTDSLEKQKNYLTHIEKQFHTIVNLTDNLASISYLDTPRNYVLKPLNITKMLHELVDSYISRTETSKSLEANLCDKIPVIWANSSDLKKAIQKIINNAIHAATPHTVRLVSRYDAEQVTITLEYFSDIDTLTSITQSFNHVSTTQAIASSEIDLFVARKIIDLHSGNVDIQSQPEDITKITISLPILHKSS